MYLWLAGLVAVFHACLVLTVVVGTGVFAARAWRRFPRFWWWAYGLAMGGMIGSELLISDCILTVWERDLRNLNRPGSAYVQSFVVQYLPCLPPALLGVVGPFLVLVAFVTLIIEWLTQRRAKRHIEEDRRRPPSPR